MVIRKQVNNLHRASMSWAHTIAVAPRVRGARIPASGLSELDITIVKSSMKKFECSDGVQAQGHSSSGAESIYSKMARLVSHASTPRCVWARLLIAPSDISCPLPSQRPADVTKGEVLLHALMHIDGSRRFGADPALANIRSSHAVRFPRAHSRSLARGLTSNNTSFIGLAWRFRPAFTAGNVCAFWRHQGTKFTRDNNPASDSVRRAATGPTEQT